MSHVLRSAELLVKNVVEDPKLQGDLKADPVETLKKLAKDAEAALPPPSGRLADAIWLIIVIAVALTLLGSVFALVTGVKVRLDAGATYLVKGETLLTIFSSSIAFLGGLLVPSPLKK